MISAYKDGVKDALYPKKGGIISRNSKLVDIKPAKEWSAADVKKLRHNLQLSQQLFADVLGVKLPTIISWENGINVPSGAASRLMDILAKTPDVLLDADILRFRTK